MANPRPMIRMRRLLYRLRTAHRRHRGPLHRAAIFAKLGHELRHTPLHMRHKLAQLDLPFRFASPRCKASITA